MNKYLPLFFAGLISASFASFAEDNVDKTVVADFSEDLLVIPCVKVKASAFDGYYNVLMEISGDGNGLDWKILHVTLASETECHADDSEDESLDNLLQSLGMPPLAELMNPHYYDQYDDESDDDDADDDTDEDNSDDEETGDGSVESEGEIIIQ